MRRYVFRGAIIVGIACIILLFFILWETPKTRIPLWQDNGNRLLIISPHPDDESLGTAGVIARSLADGYEVRVLLMTYGDGFIKAAQVFTGKKSPEPEDYLRMGRARKQETLRAMALLGLPPDRIMFLGYPDSALENLWEEHWDQESAVPTGKVRVDRVPYDDALKPGAPFSGQSVVDSLAGFISGYRPTVIYYPDPSDEHPDHWATSAFVKYTLALLNYNCREYTYLVHRSLWPQPFLEEPSKPLLPPEELLDIGTDWVDFALSKAEIDLKKRALQQYPTQEAVMEPFLWAFIRNSELFGQSPTGVITENGVILKDARADTIRRTLEGSADITGVIFARQGNDLLVTLETRSAVSNKLTYLLGLRIFNEDGKVYRADFQIDSGGVKTPLKAAHSVRPEIKSFQVSANHITLLISDNSLVHPVKLMAGAQSYEKGHRLDKTPWRLFGFQ